MPKAKSLPSDAVEDASVDAVVAKPIKATRKKSETAEASAKTKKDTVQALTTTTTNASSLYGVEPYQQGATEEYMSSGMLDHFVQVLRAWKKELMEEVDRTVTHMKDESISMADINDRATQEEEFTLELRTRDRERKLLRKIEASLKDIEEGDYGFCVTCGVEIGLRRLEARPTATLCIDCKSLAEIKEKQEKGM